jgi:hypothetical protein
VVRLGWRDAIRLACRNVLSWVQKTWAQTVGQYDGQANGALLVTTTDLILGDEHFLTLCLTVMLEAKKC